MGLKHASFLCLLIVILIQAIIVTCQNTTEPTSDPGGELSVQPFLVSTSTTAKETPTTAAEEARESTEAAKTITTTETTPAEKPPTAAKTTKEKPATTIPVRENTVSPSAATASSVIHYTVAPELVLYEESKSIMTSQPVVTSSSMKELMTLSKPMKVVDASSKDVNHMMTPDVEASQMSTRTPTLMSHPIVTSPLVLTPSNPKVQMSVSEYLEEVTTAQVQFSPLSSTAKALSPVIELITSSSQAVVVDFSKDVEHVSTPQVQTISLSSTAKPIVMPHLAVTSSKTMKSLTSSVLIAAAKSTIEEVLTSSSPRVEVKSSEIHKIKPSSTLEKEKTSLAVEQTTSSSTLKQIPSSKSEKLIMMASEIMTWSQILGKTKSQVEEEITSTVALDIVTSSEVKEEIMSSLALEIVSSSPVAEGVAFFMSTQYKQHIKEMTPLLPTKTLASIPVTSSLQSVQGVASSKVGKEILPPQTVDVSTSTSTAKVLTYSSQPQYILSSTEILISTSCKEDLTTLRPTMTSTMTSSSDMVHIVTSSESLNTMTSYLNTLNKILKQKTSSQVMSSSPVIPGLSSLRNTMSFQEVKASKSSLILSSSQLADIITSSPTAVKSTSDVVPPTEEGKRSTATDIKATTKKPQGTSTTQIAKETVMTSPHSSAPVAMTTSNMTDVTEHPTHPTHHEDKHTTHTHPEETHEHTTHPRHDENVTHPTMGYPHEPEVDASTDEKERKDADWEVSIIVVLALLGGMIAFVIFMVVKDRARTGGRNVSEDKRPVLGDDKGFVPLKDVKIEDSPKLTKAEKRLSQRNSYYGNPEDSIPLLELHIRDGAPPVLNAHDESEDAQAGEAGTVKDSKPLLEVYGDKPSRKSKENVSEDA